MKARNGLSLIEVVIALAILVGSAAALSQLIDVGQRHALRATEVSEAQFVCHNVMSELLAGTRAWEASRPQPVDPFLPWDYKVQIEPLEIGDLTAIAVTVTEQQERQLAPSPLAARIESNPREFRLVRWVRRPLDNEPSEFGGFPSRNVPGGQPNDLTP